MQSYNGKSVFEGIAMGPVTVFRKQIQVEKKEIENPQKELERFEAALEVSGKQLETLYGESVKQVGKIGAAVFEVHRMMLKDKKFIGNVRDIIRSESVNAEYAVMRTGEMFSEKFAAMPDEYLKARAADVTDIAARLVRNLQGADETVVQISRPSVIVAEDLSPSETIRLDKEKILAFVTVRGSVNSHTAILARMMNIPAIVAVPLQMGDVCDGETAIVDGISGVVTFAPDEAVQSETEKRISQEAEKRALLQELRGKENMTLDGEKIHVHANIGSLADIDSVLENDAGGIGLFRSEFLYLGRESYPTEEEQFAAYKEVVQRMDGRKVVVRTMDIGADKKEPYLGFEEEENPAMGFRAIRVCLKQPELFKVQLRALLRAAFYGDISILYPMIISEEEVKQIQQYIDEACRELDEKGMSYRIPEQGVMIETPAAVMISDRLAEQVDFFSIGTNDLTQYTLAIDRQNEKLDDFYDAHHEAVIRMIKMVVDNAHACGKYVGICGELATDMELTKQFIKMGVDELSVSPSMVLKLRKKIREMNVKDAE